MHPSRRPAAGVCSFVCLLFAICEPAWAQLTSTGSVSGLVTDQQNAVVAGAEVKMVDTATNAALTTATNEAGRYIFPTVNPGVYDLTVSRQGFSRARLGAVIDDQYTVFRLARCQSDDPERIGLSQNVFFRFRGQINREVHEEARSLSHDAFQTNASSH
jgi:hypothetical protein